MTFYRLAIVSFFFLKKAYYCKEIVQLKAFLQKNEIIYCGPKDLFHYSYEYFNEIISADKFSSIFIEQHFIIKEKCLQNYIALIYVFCVSLGIE